MSVEASNQRFVVEKLGTATERASMKGDPEFTTDIVVDNIIKSRDRDIHELSEQLDVTEQRIQKLVNGETLMRLSMAEREPQNKQNVSEGFMRGLIGRSSYQKCSDTTRQIDTNLAS